MKGDNTKRAMALKFQILGAVKRPSKISSTYWPTQQQNL